MKEMQIFNNPAFGEIRAVELDGAPWFAAADVCRALDIQNHKDAVKRLDEDEKSGVVLTDPPWKTAGNQLRQRARLVRPGIGEPEAGGQSLQALDYPFGTTESIQKKEEIE